MRALLVRHPGVRAALLTACAALLGACSGTSAQAPQGTAAVAPPPVIQEPAGKPQSVKVALLLPLSAGGEPTEIAKGMKQAAEMALFEANDPNVQLVVKDDGGSAEGAAHAATAAITEGAEVILGPLLSRSVTGAAEPARKANVPIVAFSNDANVAGNGVYLMSFLAGPEVKRVVAYAASQGKRRFAAMMPANAYGQTVEPAFRKAVSEAGGEIVKIETFNSGASDTAAAAKRIAAALTDAEKSGSPVDVLFVPAGEETIAQLAPALSGHKVQLAGTSIWDVPLIARPEALNGAWYAAPDPNAVAQFAGKFRSNYGRDPPRLANLAYEAMTAALSLAKDPKGTRFSPANLTRDEGFAGLDGKVRFNAQGLPERGLAVLAIQKYRSVVIDAPQMPENGKVAGLSKYF